ncbi:hypothetical protein BDY21DRAFT_301782 [Lineolata rhizophorae]|uniref:Ribosomal protein S15 n=1 Tax=Lineolata rhizophorae TaxID=578093 RepID=A0A6A6P3Y8_9PEZI|nr:hypothetical protein BDY21DRAFT_301782 [Lineolata rhizophorae]
MPPRLSLLSFIGASKGPSRCSHSSFLPRSFSSSPISQAAKKKRKPFDPYAAAQSRARKAANLARQQELFQQRASTLGDPVKGAETAFVRSFDAVKPTPQEVEQTAEKTGEVPNADRQLYLNHYLTPDVLKAAFSRSRRLSAPTLIDARDGDVEAAELNRDMEAHFNKVDAIAVEAMSRILSLQAGSSKDRLRANMQRCIDKFGRHNTDQTLPPRPKGRPPPNAEDQPKKLPRAGPDTGSSEVQIGILTAKIRALSKFLETRGRNDKVNKRNLRILVHRRQKLLKYLRRKERGGPRWQHCIETLGLTEGTWNGEISL